MKSARYSFSLITIVFIQNLTDNMYTRNRFEHVQEPFAQNLLFAPDRCYSVHRIKEVQKLS